MKQSQRLAIFGEIIDQLDNLAKNGQWHRTLYTTATRSSLNLNGSDGALMEMLLFGNAESLVIGYREPCIANNENKVFEHKGYKEKQKWVFDNAPKLDNALSKSSNVGKTFNNVIDAKPLSSSDQVREVVVPLSDPNFFSIVIDHIMAFAEKQRSMFSSYAFNKSKYRGDKFLNL